MTSTTTAAELAELHATLQAGLAAELDFAVGLRRELHAAADLSGSEEPTAARVAAALGEPDAPKVAGAGRLVRIGPAAGPCIALHYRAERL